MSIWGLVLAGGSGARFGAPKQFASLRGRRLVDRSVDLARGICDGVCLVLPDGHRWSGPAVDRVVTGGTTHAESTRRGCAALPADVETVFVTAPSHPLASSSLAEAVLAGRAEVDAVAPLLDVADVVRIVEEDGSSVPTTGGRFGLLQLPFALSAEVLLPTVATAGEFVEEFALVERAGGSVAMVPGDPANLHITTPADLAVAAEILAGRAQENVAGVGRKS